MNRVRWTPWHSRRGRWPVLAVLIVMIQAACGMTLIGAQDAFAIDNGLVPKPPMGVNPYGYNSLANYADTSRCDNPYPDFGACQLPSNSAMLRAQAAALIRPVTEDGESLADLGYTHIQLDGEWQGPRNGPVDSLTGQHTLTPNPHRYGTVDDFVGLLHSIRTDYVSPKYHRHLTVGIYSDWGTGINCIQPADWAYWDTGNGLAGHEATDARTFASWGISALKLDGMCANAPDGVDAEMKRIHDAFAQYAPHIWLDVYWQGATPQYSNVWRLGSDLCGCFAGHDDGWTSSVLDHLDEADSSASLVGPGNWDDMDNLLVSGNNGFGSPSPYLSPQEQRTQFGIEALAASPLQIGTDLRKVVGVPGDSHFPGDSHAMGFLTNDEVIDVDQDDRGDMGRIVERENDPDNWRVEDGRLLVDGGGAGLSKAGSDWTDYKLSFRTMPRQTGGGGAYAQAGWITRAGSGKALQWRMSNRGTSGSQDGSLTKTVVSNLALGKPATQSSTCRPEDCGIAAPASLAVDGNTSGNFADGSVSHTYADPTDDRSTYKDSTAWWQVDLQDVQHIDKINVWNRTDGYGGRLADYYVFVSDVPFTSHSIQDTLAQPGVWSSHQTTQAGSPTSIDVGRTGRYVRIQQANPQFLALAEVQVMGSTSKVVPLPFPVQADHWYQVESKNVGNTVETRIDGTLVDTMTTDAEHAGGQVGFLEDGDESAYFDDVNVTSTDGTVLLADDFSGDLSLWDRPTIAMAQKNVLSKVLGGPGQRAVGLLNRTDSPRKVTVDFDKLRGDDGGPGGLTNVTRVRDLWTHQNIDPSLWQGTGSYTVTVPAHGIDVLKVWGESHG